MNTKRTTLVLSALLWAAAASTSLAITYTTLDDPLGTNGTFAFGISGGNVVGFYSNLGTSVPFAGEHGFLYNGSTYTSLDYPSGTNLTEAYAISGGNIVGGYAQTDGFRYNGGNYMTVHDPLQGNGNGYSAVRGIDGGNMVGFYNDGGPTFHGYLYNGSTFTTLDDPLTATETEALGISGSKIVGYYVDSTSKVYGFLYNGSTYTTLDDPLGTNGTFATAISGSNIVGYYLDSMSHQHGFFYDGSTYTTLDVPLAVFTNALGIDGNKVVGYYYDSFGGHGFLATVPEPSTFVLAALGFLGMFAWRRRGLLMCMLVAAATLAVSDARADVAYSWGNNQYGELGDGTTTNHRTTPFAVAGLSGGVTAVAAGSYHSLAVQNGGVYAWGQNDTAQLGDGTLFQRNPAVPVTGLSSGVTAVAAGSFHSLAIQNGGAYAWGFNTGDLGDGTTIEHLTPVAVIGMSSGVTAIAAGHGHSLGVQNGGLYAWGDNIKGALGDGTTTNRTTPVAVIGLASGVTAISAGVGDSLAVHNGGAYAWGQNNLGQLGDGSTTNRNTPVAVTGLSSGVTSIAGGAYHSLAVRNGGVYTWGDNGTGELGDGTTTPHLTPEQIDSADLHNIIAVAAGANSSYALSSDGSLWVWGENLGGQMGLGNENETFVYLTPQHLLPPSGYMFTSIDATNLSLHAVATLTATPEPATFVLAALGFLSLFACSRQRSRRSGHSRQDRLVSWSVFCVERVRRANFCGLRRKEVVMPFLA